VPTATTKAHRSKQRATLRDVHAVAAGTIGEDRKTRCFVWFLWIAGMVFLLTGAAKILADFGGAKLLSGVDPILGITYKHLLPMVGLMELAVAVVCLVGRIRLAIKTAMVAWLATNFLVYRLGLWCIGWEHPCACMGNLAAALHLSDQQADLIMRGILVFLLAGSYGLLLVEWRSRRLSAIVSKAQ
jgi:hypothetical protein